MTGYRRISRETLYPHQQIALDAIKRGRIKLPCSNNMEPRKQAILEALDAFVWQRSGMDYRNYGDQSSYNADRRTITQAGKHYRELRAAVAWRESLTADDILAEASRGGRLTIIDASDHNTLTYDVDYTTGQYFATEYRGAACRLLASVLWSWTRDHAMPAPLTGEPRTYVFHKPGHKSPDALSAGDWLRGHFAKEFGRGIAARYFR